MTRASSDKIYTFGPELDRAKQHELLLVEIENFDRWLATLTALVEEELPAGEFIPKWLDALKKWTLERKRAQKRLNWKWDAKHRRGDLIDRDLRRAISRGRAAVEQARARLAEREAHARTLAEGETAARKPEASQTRPVLPPRRETPGSDSRAVQPEARAVNVADVGRDPSQLNPMVRLMIERALDIDVMTTSDSEIVRLYVARGVLPKLAQEYVEQLHN